MIIFPNTMGSHSMNYERGNGMKRILNKGGLFQLSDAMRSKLSGTKYYNEDLAPTLYSQRNWTAYNIAACWIGMNVCIPAYQMASSAVTMGLSWWLSLLLVAIGNFIILIPIALNAHVGTKYGIPFPVYARLSFGMRGAQIPSVVRSIIGVGWTGILIWQGAESLQVAMCLIVPGWESFAGGQWVMFAIFWLLNIGIAYGGDDIMKRFESISAPLLGLVCGALLVWGIMVTVDAGVGIGDTLNAVEAPADLNMTETVIACLVANIGFYSTWALNIPDLTRYCESQKSQLKGQILGMPLSMVAIAFIGVFVTGASALAFGEPVWDPNGIVRAIGSPWAAIFAAFGISLATLTTNVTTNILPPVNGICNLWPKKLTYRRSVIIVGIICIIMQPWKLVSDPTGYIYDWLGTYSAFTGPIASILIYDYYLLRKRRLALDELYTERDTRYWYKNGFNVRAIVAWGLSILLPVLGHFIPLFEVFALYGWILSFALGFVFYPLLMHGEKKSLVSEQEEAEMVEDITDDASAAQ